MAFRQDQVRRALLAQDILIEAGGTLLGLYDHVKREWVYGVEGVRIHKEGEPRKGDSNLQTTAGSILRANKPSDGEPLNRLHVTTYSLTFAPVEEQTGKNAKIKVEAEGDVWGNITSLERDVARRVISTHRARLGQVGAIKSG